MATNSFTIDKAVKLGEFFLIEQEVGGEVNDTNEYTMQLPPGLPLRLVSATALATAAGAATNTQVLTIKKVSVSGSATSVVSWPGSALNNIAADTLASNPSIDASEVNFEDGGGIRFCMAWGAADTAKCRVSVMLTRR